MSFSKFTEGFYGIKKGVKSGIYHWIRNSECDRWQTRLMTRKLVSISCVFFPRRCLLWYCLHDAMKAVGCFLFSQGVSIYLVLIRWFGINLKIWVGYVKAFWLNWYVLVVPYNVEKIWCSHQTRKGKVKNQRFDSHLSQGWTVMLLLSHSFSLFYFIFCFNHCLFHLTGVICCRSGYWI